MKKSLNILYRGPLESCNYDCQYCPFAKKRNTRQELAYDKNCLEQFVEWVAIQKRKIGILFTPWGEALIRKYYQDAILELSHIAHVEKVAIQTNLSSRLEWLLHVNKQKVALWTTFHPMEVDIERFIQKCLTLIQMDIPFSVGIVGKHENFTFAQRLREQLPSSIYVWINAYKRTPNYYTPKDIDFLQQIDPLFHLNNTIYNTKNKACFAGESSISIDGEGNIKRCHFIKKNIGNIYKQDLESILKPSVCTTNNCRCYIGYMNLKELELDKIYGNKLLERIKI